MMRTSKRQPALLLATALLGAAFLSACGSSSGGTDPAASPAAPDLFLTGAIQARQPGRIQVNGVAVATTGAVVRIEKAERPEGELEAGMVVKVKAHRGGGAAAAGLEIEAEDAVKGKVESKDRLTLSVGGQVVRVDDSTEFGDDAARLGGVALGSRVRVFATADDQGGLRASRVEPDDRGVADEFEVKGFVTSPPPYAAGFTLGLVPGAVDYTVALAGAAIPAGLREGSFVEVRSSGPVQGGAVIQATSISLEDAVSGGAGDEVEVEGVVTDGTAASFVAAGLTVTTSGSTRWDGGLPDDLVPGVKVEAEGRLAADGSLAAHKVSFRYNVKLFGYVSAYAASGAFAATMTLNGIPVALTENTDWRTASGALAVGTWVELRGFTGRDGLSVSATRVEAKSPGNARPVVQGVVTAKDAGAGTVVILGKTIAADASTSFHDHSDASGSSGPSLSRADFLAAVTAGETVVKARGLDDADWTGSPVAAREMELEGGP